MLNLNEYNINEYLISKQLQYTTSHARAPNGYKKNKASNIKHVWATASCRSGYIITSAAL